MDYHYPILEDAELIIIIINTLHNTMNYHQHIN